MDGENNGNNETSGEFVDFGEDFGLLGRRRGMQPAAFSGPMVSVQKTRGGYAREIIYDRDPEGWGLL